MWFKPFVNCSRWLKIFGLHLSDGTLYSPETNRREMIHLPLIVDPSKAQVFSKGESIRAPIFPSKPEICERERFAMRTAGIETVCHDPIYHITFVTLVMMSQLSSSVFAFYLRTEIRKFHSIYGSIRLLYSMLHCLVDKFGIERCFGESSG